DTGSGRQLRRLMVRLVSGAATDSVGPTPHAGLAAHGCPVSKAKPHIGMLTEPGIAAVAGRATRLTVNATEGAATRRTAITMVRTIRCLNPLLDVSYVIAPPPLAIQASRQGGSSSWSSSPPGRRRNCRALFQSGCAT